MPDDDAPVLTDAEREFLMRSGMDAARYAAIRDVPTSSGRGVRSVQEISAALTAAAAKQEADR